MRGLFSVYGAIRRASVRAVALGILGLIGVGVMAGSARATGSYPGETLSLAVPSSAVVGKATNIVASGNQADVNAYNGGFAYSPFDLEVYAKDPSVDPNCAPDYTAENNSAITNPSETQVVIGLGQGTGTTFGVPFNVVFSRTGPVLLCAYSVYITDTAASAQLKFNVVSSPGKPKPTLAHRAKIACKAELKKKGKKKFQAKYGHKNTLGNCISRYKHTHK